jgi:hypothetical protein
MASLVATTVNGNLTPSANGTHNLGASTAYWKNAYLEDTAINGTLYAGGTLTAAGNLDIAQYLRHTGDTNTQIRFESSQITIGTSGGCRMSFNADEKLYFYTGTTPTLALTLDTSQAAIFAGTVKIQSTAPTIKLYDTNSDTNSIQVEVNGGNFRLYKYTGSTDASHAEIFKLTTAGAVTFNGAFTFPTTDGSNGQFLQTNGSGTVTWASAGSGTVTGSGTTSYVPKFTSSTALGNSALYDGGGSNIGIGTNNPYYALDVRFTNNTTSFSGGNSGNWGGSGLRLQNASTTAGAMALIQFRTSTAEWFIGNKFISSSPDKSDFIFNHEDSEKVRFTNDGNVGIGTDAPSELLEVKGNITLRGGTNHRLKIANDSNNNWSEIGNDGATGENTLEFFTGSSSVPSMSITNAKQVLVGDSTALGPFGEWNWTPLLQQLGTQGIVTVRCGADVYGGAMHLASARGSNASPTIVLNGDRAGGVYYHAYDGANFSNTPGAIECFIDGAPAADDTPGRLVFSTAPDGSNSITERMRITSAGSVGIGTVTPGALLEVYAASGAVLSHVKSGSVISRLTANSTTSDGTVGTSSAHDFLIQRAGSTRITLSGSSVVVNDTGEDIDFRVEGDGDANLIRTDAANDRVGIGTNNPSAKLESYITSGGEKGLRLNSNFAGGNAVDFIPAVVGVSNAGFSIDLAGTNRFVINDGGNVGIGTNNALDKLDVYGTGAIFRNLSDDADSVQIVRGTNHTASPDAKFYIYDNSSADWAAKINLDGASYGLDITGGASYFLLCREANGTSLLEVHNSRMVINEGGRDMDFRVEGDTDDYLLFTEGSTDRVAISTNTPLAKLHVEGDARVGSTNNGNWMGYKDVAMNGSSYTTALTINLANHTACHVKLFITGDWSSHSAVAFVGEYFVQNGGDGYQEPGQIISEFDNTNTDLIMSKIVDPSTDTFTIQLKLSTTANGSFTGKLSYHVMGMATAVS